MTEEINKATYLVAFSFYCLESLNNPVILPII